MKVAIVGCGNISRLHFAAASENPLSEIVAAVDTKPERAEKFAEKYGCKAYTDFYEMLEKENPDTVHICTPHCFHTQYAVSALSKGINVLSEKPCSINDAEVETLRNAQKNSEAKYAVCFQNRFNACVRELLNLRSSGKYGKVKAIRAFVTWCRNEDYYSDDWHGTLSKEGGCLLINQAIHTLDLITYLGGRCEALTAHVSNDHLSGVIEGEDTACIRLELENGVNAVFYGTTGYGSNAPVLIEVAFENAVFRLEGEKLFSIGSDGTITEIETSKGKAEGKDYWGSGHPALINAFYNSIVENKDFEIDSFSGGQAEKIVFAAYRSSAEGRKVILDK